MGLKDLQNMLNGHGFPCGAADGDLGPATKAAVARFQTAFNGPGGWLDIDGVPGPKTEKAILWMQDTGCLGTYFSVAELACKHCSRCYVKRDLLSAGFKLREHIGRPLKVVSGYRCEVRNAQVGGAPSSSHLLGLALDIAGVSVAEARAARAFNRIGTPDQRRATHVDMNSGNPNNPVVFYDKSTG